MYDPFGRPVKLKFPKLSVMEERDTGPDNVTVAADPLTRPEILYVGVGVGVGVGVVDAGPALKTTSTQ
jgi:hypothetical protein